MKSTEIAIQRVSVKDLKLLTEMGRGLCLEMQKIDPAIKFERGFGKKLSKWYSRNMRKKNSLFLKAILDGRIAGFLLCEIQRDIPILAPKFVGRIHDVYVLPEYRKRGVCSSLISETIKWLRKHKINTVKLGTLSRNAPAIRAYEKHGFREYEKQMRRRI